MLLRTNEVPQILQKITSLQPGDGDVILLLFSEQSVPDIPALIDELNRLNISFLGGVFPGLIYGNEHIKDGCIIKKFKSLMEPFCVSDIASSQFSNFPEDAPMCDSTRGTAIVLLDALSTNIYLFLEKLNNLLGEQCNFIGGGAGYMNLQQQPCVFSRDGFQKDAAVVCVIDMEIKLGVRHGWEQIAGPLVATQTEMNTIIQLNWEKAVDVYFKIIEAVCGASLDKNNFATIAQEYPFGIMREKEDDIVRDPLSIGENGSIVCICEVPPNTVLHVLRGRTGALLGAAQKAMSDCAGDLTLPIAVEGTFVVDCITRTLFLKDKFAEEMNIIRENLVITTDEQEPFGILSLGEISSYGEGLLELYNKTIVIGTFQS